MDSGRCEWCGTTHQLREIEMHSSPSVICEACFSELADDYAEEGDPNTKDGLR